jgi:hypothetical protein
MRMPITPLGACDARDYQEIFNPKPVGEQVNPHVHVGVAETRPDYEAQRVFIEQPDFRKVFTK